MSAIVITFLSFGCSETIGDQVQDDLSFLELERKLNSLLPEDVIVKSIEETDIEGYLEVSLEGMESFFVSENGKFIISGDIFEITSEGLINRSEVRRSAYRKKIVNDLDSSEFITFRPNAVRHSIFVFTDVDCGYCRQFHAQMAEYLELGIKVNYLAFPRAGANSDSYKRIASAWCSKDPNNAITELKLGNEIKENVCLDNPVIKHFDLGNSLGVTGTPSIITSEGKLIPGYIPAENLIGLLES
tara:strand:- start:24948 stop:25679 length:732 start_codon:yes stop_codon:yes gene_type:complete